MQLSRIRGVAALLLGGVAGACGDPASPEVEPGVGARVEIVSGDEQEAVTRIPGFIPMGSGAMPEPLRVRVTDAGGRPLAGQIVNWTTTGGTVSPTPIRTDAGGMASVHWSMFSPNGGWVSWPGTVRATASVHGGSRAAVFRGYARRGVHPWEIAFSPEAADVRAGAATVTMSVRLWDDRREGSIGPVRAWLRGPATTSGAGGTVFAELALAGSAPGAIVTETDSYDLQEWSGTLTLPADAAPGDWKVDRLEVGWGPGAGDRGELAGTFLEQLWGRTVLHVIGGAPGA